MNILTIMADINKIKDTINIPIMNRNITRRCLS